MVRNVLFLLLTLASYSAHAGFTVVDAHGTSVASSSTTLVYAGNITGVQAGDLVVACVGNGQGGPTTISVSDGTSTLTDANEPIAFNAGAGELELHYLLSSVATGSPTYTITYGAARSYRTAVIIVYRPTDTVQFIDMTTATGTSNTAATGNLTLSGEDMLATACLYTWTLQNLAAAAKGFDGEAAEGEFSTDRATQFYKTYTSGFTGPAGAVMSGSTNWAINFSYFRIEAVEPEGVAPISTLQNLGKGIGPHKSQQLGGILESL